MTNYNTEKYGQTLDQTSVQMMMLLRRQYLFGIRKINFDNIIYISDKSWDYISNQTYAYNSFGDIKNIFRETMRKLIDEINGNSDGDNGFVITETDEYGDFDTDEINRNLYRFIDGYIVDREKNLDTQEQSLLERICACFACNSNRKNKI